MRVVCAGLIGDDRAGRGYKNLTLQLMHKQNGYE